MLFNKPKIVLLVQLISFVVSSRCFEILAKHFENLNALCLSLLFFQKNKFVQFLF